MKFHYIFLSLTLTNACFSMGPINKNLPKLGSFFLKIMPVLRSHSYITPIIETKKSMTDDLDKDMVHPKWAKDIPNGVPKRLDQVVSFINNPEQFTKLGARMNKGAILYGPPGTGKTTIARAIAEATGYNFAACAGTHFTAEVHGKGAKMIRQLFDTARENSPIIIFIDEIDVIAEKRSNAYAANTEQLLELLNQLDGFNKDNESKIFVFAATNNIDKIDPALIRPGRLGEKIEIPLPGLNGREKILSYYMKNIKVKESVSSQNKLAAQIAQETKGFSGADLSHLVNQAAINAGYENARFVEAKHLQMALEKMLHEKNNQEKIVD